MVGIAQDISARKSTEEQMARNLNWAESAWAEADAFRKTTLALTQNLKMDCCGAQKPHPDYATVLSSRYS